MGLHLQRFRTRAFVGSEETRERRGGRDRLQIRTSCRSPAFAFWGDVGAGSGVTQRRGERPASPLEARSSTIIFPVFKAFLSSSVVAAGSHRTQGR